MSAFNLRLQNALNIRPNESRLVALVIGVMLLTSAGFKLGSTAVDALFLSRFGVQYLPNMFMLQGISSFVTTLGITALLGRFRREQMYVFIPVSVIILTVVAWGLLFTGWSGIYPVLWLGKEIINSLVSLVVWGLAGAVCDTRQSKRLFPLFNAGRILGTVLGGLSTGILVNLIGTPNLMLAWTGMTILSILFTRRLINQYFIPDALPPRSRRKQPPGLIQEMQRGYQFVRSSALMRWVSLAAILFSILYRSIELPFSTTAAAQFPDENALAGFLGTFDGLCTAAAFLASIFVANRLYARFGIMNAILALPVIYFLGFSGLVITNTFAVIIIFRFVQMMWLSGIADSAYQAMFNAVPSARRDQVRAFIGGVPEQAGTIIAGAILVGGDKMALLGLISAGVTIFIILRSSRAYYRSLVDALRAGRPALFVADDRLGPRPDATAMHVILEGLNSPDPATRRISIGMLPDLDGPGIITALVNALQDEDMEVRCNALKGLAARPGAASALLEIATRLDDPVPVVRGQAVDALRALTPYQHALLAMLFPLTNDPDPGVRVRAFVALVGLGGQGEARSRLREMAMDGTVGERVLALNALSEVGDPQGLSLFSTLLTDNDTPPEIRSASATTLGLCGPVALPVLKTALALDDSAVLAGVVTGFVKIGQPALPVILTALAEPRLEPAALQVLERLPARAESAWVREYARSRIESSLHYESLRIAVPSSENDRLTLLHESLAARSRRDGIFALRALSLLGDHETLTAAVDHLQSRDPAQHASALEALEAIHDAALVRPLFRVWEPVLGARSTINTQQSVTLLLNETDTWLQDCAKYVNSTEDQSMNAPTTLSIMDRVLTLRRVPLLADLPPADLKRVAEISGELDFLDGDVICEQGEPGDEMYVIISGNARVVVSHAGLPEKEVAHRSAGDVVGEMSIISGETRVASVIAAGDVRVLCLDRLSFQSLLRERPEVSMAIMRELCRRLTQLM